MFDLLTVGDWGEDAVAARWSDRSSRWIVPEVEAAIERTWAAHARRPGIQLFDGPLCRLESWRGDAQRLELTLSPTRYKAFFGTNLNNIELADVYGDGILSNPVGVSAMLLSADNALILGRRNAAVAYYPDRLHPFAGGLEPSDVQGERPNAFNAVRRELREELSLRDADVTAIRCLGIVQDRAIRQPEMVFLVHTPRTRAALQENVDQVEHGGSAAVEATPEAIGAFVGEHASELTPVAHASLALVAGYRRPDSASLDRA
jgi:hypothetical protein